MKKNEDWEEKLDLLPINLGHISEAGKETTSKEKLIAFIQTLLAEKEKETTSKLKERIEGMFSVYPDGGIHDFAEDEELISKKQVLAFLETEGKPKESIQNNCKNEKK